MAEIRDRLVLDDTQARQAIDRVVRAAIKMGDAGDDAGKAFRRGLGSAGSVAKDLAAEIERLNRKATLDRAKAASNEYRKALERAQSAALGLRRASEDAGGSSKKTGESFFTTANQAGQLAQQVIAAGRALREFALAGVDASRVAAQFEGNIEQLRRASGGAVDDTTLQRLDIMARRTGLASKEIAAFTRIATKLARQEGKELAETFQQLIDASPEQLEKWGILTSDLTERMKGLDTVQQKALLRQRLVREGMAITNDEIAEGTHALERQGASWDNFVSSLQEGAAEILGSEGVSSAIDRMQSDIVKATENVIAATKAWAEFRGALLEKIGLEDVGIVEFFKWGWETSVIGQIAKAEERYRMFLRAISGGAVVKKAAAVADVSLTAQRGLQAQKIAGAMSDQGRIGLAARETDPDVVETLYATTPDAFDFTQDPKPKGKRRKPLGDGLGIESFLSGLGPGFGQDGDASFLANLLNPANDDGEFMSSLDAGLTAVTDRYSTAFDSLAFEAEQAFERISASMENNRKFAIATAQGVGNAFGSAFDNALNSGMSFRENMMAVLGELWGQLSAGFLAWATAEGNLLAGNPFGAVAAAVALGAIGSVISSIGSRGSSGGTGNTNAQRFNEQQRQREEESRETELTVNLVGIPVPDKTARELADAIDRNLLLRGAA